jgi:hypothetical protein
MKIKPILFSVISGLTTMVLLRISHHYTNFNRDLIDSRLFYLPGVVFGIITAFGLGPKSIVRKISFILLSIGIYYAAVVISLYIEGRRDSNYDWSVLAYYIAGAFGATAFILSFHFLLQKINKLPSSLILGVIASSVAFFLSRLIPSTRHGWNQFLFFLFWQTGVGIAISFGIKREENKP